MITEYTNEDRRRINHALYIVFNVMLDYKWRTFKEIQEQALTKYQKYIPEPSISAHLRKFRTHNKGLSLVKRNRKNEKGLYEYQLIASIKAIKLMSFKDLSLYYDVYQKNYSLEFHLQNGGTIENYKHDY